MQLNCFGLQLHCLGFIEADSTNQIAVIFLGILLNKLRKRDVQ